MSTSRRSGGQSEKGRSHESSGVNRPSVRERRSDDRPNPAAMPLMAERRLPPPDMFRGMPVKFSGQAFSESELLNDLPKKQFIGRCRLFVGNLPLEIKEAELKELFTPHGDIAECYLSGKGFAFLRLDTRAHAESAKEALDGKSIRGRQIRVRYAVHGATIKIKELSPVVSNEMLHLTFSAFGDVERAVHIVDEKGKPTGEGIIEFERKVSAQEAIAQIRDRIFLMTANSRPLQAEFLEPRDDEDGLSEKMIQKTHQLIKERELGPRFAAMHSFEYVYGRRWKELYDYEQKRRAELDAELRENRRRLDADMELEYEDYKAQLLREELQRRQEELERLEASRQLRRQQQQQHQLMGGMMRGWEPQLVDGPLGRNLPPTFGPGGPPRQMMGASPGMPLPGPQPLHMGPLLRGEDGDHRDSTGGGGIVEMQNGSGQSLHGGPDVRKMLQGFRDSPHPNRASPQSGRQQLPHGLAGLFDRPQQLQNPLAAFLSPGQAPGGDATGANGPPPPPPGPGGRIPPPPPPMGAPPPLMGVLANSGDFPPDKRPRHG